MTWCIKFTWPSWNVMSMLAAFTIRYSTNTSSFESWLPELKDQRSSFLDCNLLKIFLKVHWKIYIFSILVSADLELCFASSNSLLQSLEVHSKYIVLWLSIIIRTFWKMSEYMASGTNPRETTAPPPPPKVQIWMVTWVEEKV